MGNIHDSRQRLLQIGGKINTFSCTNKIINKKYSKKYTFCQLLITNCLINRLFSLFQKKTLQNIY